MSTEDPLVPDVNNGSPGSSEAYSLLPLIPLSAITNPDGSSADVTCIESLDQSIYIGTSAGEILHFFRADDGQSSEPFYIIASRQKTYNKKLRPVNQIVLLPPVSRALVLTGNKTSVFTLPELAPKSEVGSMKDVASLSRDIDITDRQKAEKSPTSSQELITVFTKSAIRIVGVGLDSLKLVRNIDYQGVVTGLRRSSFALVSNLETYDLIDLDNILKIPLVPVSSGTADEVAPASLTTSAEDSGSIDSSVKRSSALKPLIVAVDEDEFLIATGSKAEEPAVGIIVNTKGDITRSTITWPAYPSSLTVDKSCAMAAVGSQILIHSLSDQALVQVIDFDSPPVLASVYTEYKIPRPGLADKLDIITLTGEENDNSPHVAAPPQVVMTINSSIMTYSSAGLQCIMPSPEAHQLEDYITSGELDSANSWIDMASASSPKDAPSAELEYYCILLALGYLLHENYQDALAYWLSTETLDPRLLIYLLSSDVVQGCLKIPKGAHNLIESLQNKYKTSPLNRNEGLLIFYNNLLDEWLKRKNVPLTSYSNNSEAYDIMLSLRLAKLKLILDDSYHIDSMLMLSNDFNNFINALPTDQVPLMVPLFEKYERYFDLSRMYRAHHMHKETLHIWQKILTHEWEDNRFIGGDEKMYRYLVGLDDKELVWEYGMWLVEHSSKYGLQVFTNPDTVVKFDDSDVVSALKKLDDDVPWRKYLRFLVYEKKSNLFVSDLIAFMLDDIIEKLTTNPDNQKALRETYALYKDLTLPKRSYLEYFKSVNVEDSDIAEFMGLRLELCHLLGTDVYYDLSKTLNVLETNTLCTEFLILERCIVYSRMGYTEKCLDTLCHELTDYNTALTYSVYGLLLASTDIAGAIKPMEKQLQKNMFKLLYRELLKLEKDADRKVYMRILFEKYGSNLDLNTVLTESPGSWSVELLGDYLVQTFRINLKEQRESSLFKSIARSENVYISKQLAWLTENCINRDGGKVEEHREETSGRN